MRILRIYIPFLENYNLQYKMSQLENKNDLAQTRAIYNTLLVDEN